HPHADIRRGEAFLNLIYSVVTRGPAWRNTVLVVNYDEWGGFFDHVPPPTAAIPDADRVAGNADGRLGFRTPALLVAPWARAGFVSHQVYDHTSVLKMIEWRWGLEPLSVRDRDAANLADALDFAQPRPKPPLFAVPPGAPSLPCELTEALDEISLEHLRELALRHGWPVYD
ncbi:MAG TPA: alkaline phosphatase family protein, partial [Polyangiaceae bacterium]|nr:alkaline phosphatase family protein [Polyangiaceae bacterium]